MELHISQCLKGHSFFMMPSIPYDVLFKRQSMMNACIIEDKLLRSPFALFKRAFFPEVSSIEYSKQDSSKILFYISETKRPNSINNFKKVVSTVETADVLIENYSKGRFSFSGIILFFFLQPIWFFSMLGKGLLLIEKIQILKELTVAYHSLKVFRSINYTKYKLFVTFNDSLVRECMLSLIFHQHGVCTATLQHGQFNAWRENTISNCGLEFGSSPSDFQLCWNQYAQDEAIKAGWSKERLPIVGIMSNIGRKAERCINHNNHVFGIVICHPFWQDENLMMIQAANTLAKQIGYKYYLKLHPSYSIHAFDKLIDKDFYLGAIPVDMDIMDYANFVDFSIVGSTSVYAELVYCYHNILRYSSGKSSDKYFPIQQGTIFTSDKNIYEAYKNISEKGKDALFDYLCASNNTSDLYYRFFNSFQQ